MNEKQGKGNKTTMTQTKSRLSSRTQTAVFCGLTIALITVSAWISIPIWVIPVTLQTFVLIFALLFLTPRQYLLSYVTYLFLGAIGLPVFSSMRGGLGVIAGPTGGFLWGFLLGAFCVFLFLWAFRTRQKNVAPSSEQGFIDTQPIKHLSGKRGFGIALTAALIFLAVMYLCGWLQLIFITGMSPQAAFATGVAPFALIDVIKAFLAIFTARAVARAVVVRSPQ
ncbi:MAG: biotin transporter BioY [Eggerthellaceae bacterium]|nr:biotin transporter BioY [Eggerthellaceae bacterium]